MADLIEIEVGTDAEGKPVKVAIPKTFKDADGNDYDGQNIINQVNGKVKSVTEAKLNKKYEAQITELETIRERTKHMISSEDAQKLQLEIEELRTKQLPEKEQEIERLRLQSQSKDKDVAKWQKEAEQKDNRYKEYRINQELLLNLPSGANGVIDEIRGDQVEILKKYATLNEKDEIVMRNLFEEGGEPISIKVFMEKYYADSSRAAYLKSSWASGGGTQQTRNLGGKETISSKAWQIKLASASMEERVKMNKMFSSGEVIIRD